MARETYEVRVAEAGFTFTPIRPAQPLLAGGGPGLPREEAAPVTFETVSIERGKRVLSALGASGRLEAGDHWVIERGEALEHVRAQDRGVEQSWSFARKPAGTGNLVVRVRASGQTFTKDSKQGLHFKDERTDIGLLYGEALWVDARGHRTPVLTRYAKGEILLEVPASALESATYPAVLDPVISAEFMMQDASFPAISGAQSSPAVVFDGVHGHQLVVWANQRPGNANDIYGALLNPDGTLNQGGFVIASGINDQTNPAVSFDGTNFLVVWEEATGISKDIYGARVSATGTVLDSGTNVLKITEATNDQATPKVAFDGTHHVVVWKDGRNGAGTGDVGVYGARVSTAGALLDVTGVALSPSGGVHVNPAIAAGSGGMLIAWEKSTGGVSHLYGLRVSAGSLTAQPPTDLSPNSSVGQYTPSIAYDSASGSYLVAWSDARSSTGTRDIYATHVSSSGTVQELAGIALSTAAEDQLTPAVTATGDGFFVTWQDWRSSSDYDIYGTRVLQSGQIADSAGLLVAATPSVDEQPPAVGYAPAPFGRTVVTLYSSLNRIRGKIVSLQLQGSTCSLNADCASGYCVDGVCCNAACGGTNLNDCTVCSVAAGASANGTCTALTGSNCSDGDLCTQTDTCQAGTCTGTNPVTCTAMDQCHSAGTCNTTTGTCTNPAKPNGASCNDSNLCTQTDTCQNGTCSGSNPVSCLPLDQCHSAGTCNTTTGACSNPLKPRGTACNDGNSCTVSDSCKVGTCSGWVPSETCNSKDDNCDGIVDNIPATTCSVGQCRYGTNYCAGGATYCSYSGNYQYGTPCSGGWCDGYGKCCGTTWRWIPGYWTYEYYWVWTWVWIWYWWSPWWWGWWWWGWWGWWWGYWTLWGYWVYHPGYYILVYSCF